MFLSLKTLYRKRTVIWPFTTQLYGLYLIFVFEIKANEKKIIKVLVICVEISIGFTALGTILKKVTQLIIR